MISYLLDPDIFTRNIIDAEVIMLAIDFFEKNNLPNNVETWKVRLLEQLKLVNKDEYYNYNISQIEQKDLINKKASKYFIDDDEKSHEFIKVSLSIDSKIKPDNNKSLRQSIQDSDLSNSFKTYKSQKINSIDDFALIVNEFSIENKDLFIVEFKNKISILINSFDSNLFVNDLSVLVLKQDVKLIPILFSIIIESLNSLYLQLLKSGNYEKVNQVKSLIKLFDEKKYLFYFIEERSFNELLAEFNIHSFDLFLKKDFQKGVDFLNQLVNLKKDHQLLFEIGNYYGDLNNLSFFIESNYDVNVLLLIFLNLKIYNHDKHNFVASFFNCNLGKFDLSMKFFTDIKSDSLKIELIDFIWMRLIKNQEYDFLVENLIYWINKVKYIEKFIQLCCDNKLDIYLNKVFDLLDKDLFFEIIVKYYIEKKNELEIINLCIKYMNYKSKIDLIYNSYLEKYLEKEIESAITNSNCSCIPELIKYYPDKALFVEKLVLKYLLSKHKYEFNINYLMNDDDIIILIALFQRNYEILKLSIFEKAKRVLLLNEDSLIKEPINSILDLEVWKLAIKK